MRDAFSETAAPAGDRNPASAADAHEAASELSLWLRHMASDFHAIDDLASQAPPGEYRSPAHFPETLRAQEIARWGKRIKTQSYATLGRRPCRFDSGSAAPRWDLSNPWTYPECTKDATLAAGTDLVYRIGYRACAGGPFQHRIPDDAPMPRHLNSQKQQISLWRKSDRMELWDNDGIVNTASMLWPDIRETVLVLGDHMDIVGHYKLVKLDQRTGTGRGVCGLRSDGVGVTGLDDGHIRGSVEQSVRFCATGL